MRRLLAWAALAAGALLVLAPLRVHANIENAVPTRSRVVWRHVNANNQDAFNRYGFVYPESTTFTLNGQANANRETTAWYSQEGWVPYGRWGGTSGTAAVDTMFWCRLDVTPVSPRTLFGGAGRNDTVYVYVQTAADPANPKAMTNEQEIAALSTSSDSSFYWVFRQAIAATGEIGVQTVSGTAPARNQFFGDPWVRFIIRGDLQGKFEGSITRCVLASPTTQQVITGP